MSNALLTAFGANVMVNVKREYDRNPAFDGPMGIFADFEGCESGMTPSSLLDEENRLEQEERQFHHDASYLSY